MGHPYHSCIEMKCRRVPELPLLPFCALAVLSHCNLVQAAWCFEYLRASTPCSRSGKSRMTHMAGIHSEPRPDYGLMILKEDGADRISLKPSFSWTCGTLPLFHVAANVASLLHQCAQQLAQVMAFTW